MQSRYSSLDESEEYAAASTIEAPRCKETGNWEKFSFSLSIEPRIAKEREKAFLLTHRRKTDRVIKVVLPGR